MNSDRWIREHKGSNRPFFCAADRRLLLEACRFVDEVHEFDTEEELAELIRRRRPALVKGEEYRDRHVTGATEASRVVFLEGNFVGGITHNVVRKILEDPCQVN